MKTLKEINAYYRTDWKRGDLVELLPEDGGKAGETFRLTGRLFNGTMYLSAIIWHKLTPKGLRVPLHAKSIRRIPETLVPEYYRSKRKG